MKKLAVLTVAALFLVQGCASQIMQSYVGKDVREVLVDYGPPTNAFDMGDGQRAFQWSIDSKYTTPVVATTSGNATHFGSSTWLNSNTVISGGQTITSRCLYTFFAEWDENGKNWTIKSFRKPKLTCE